MNYTKLAKTFNIKKRLRDTLQKCERNTSFNFQKAEEIMDSGHVVSTVTVGLKGAWLNELSWKAKKFRLT